MTAEEYRALLEKDFEDVDIKNMPDLKELRIDRTLSLEQRKKQYLNKVANPYIVRCGNMKIKVRFANNGVSLEEAFKNMVLTA